MAFLGHYEHSLDAKDRVTVPSRFRAALADGVVLAAGLDPCVEVWAPAGYERFADTVLAGIDSLSSKGRLLRRFFHGNAFDEGLDAAGRIRIPRHLVEHGGLEGPCVVKGMHDHFEIWSAEEWGKRAADAQASAFEAAENLSNLD